MQLFLYIFSLIQVYFVKKKRNIKKKLLCNKKKHINWPNFGVLQLKKEDINDNDQ